MAIESRRPSAGTPAESVASRVDAGTPPADAVPTGFPTVDRLLGGGLRRQDLVVLAGDVGSGKSALGLAIALRAARLGTPTVVLSGEMGEERLRERVLAIEGRVPVDDLRRGSLEPTARAALDDLAGELAKLPLAFRPLLGWEFAEIEREVAAAPDAGLVVVDALQHVAPPRPAARADERVALATRALKAVALARRVAILALAHLGRPVATRPDPRPTLDDLGGRGAVKQQADVVLGLYREEMYRPDQGIEGAAELLVAKNRSGPTGFVDLYFYRRWLRFEDLAEGGPD
ncbi:MAG TPA: DnaB-like helicase C-terminal domain-containing protein [Gemmatimonadales bacterium]|nr:DnaB-like helicase C-terminal domain-containing protein [Gemmatimonadales bacterium]